MISYVHTFFLFISRNTNIHYTLLLFAFHNILNVCLIENETKPKQKNTYLLNVHIPCSKITLNLIFNKHKNVKIDADYIIGKMKKKLQFTNTLSDNGFCKNENNIRTKIKIICMSNGA